MLRNVSLSRTFPKHIFACQPAPVVVKLTNQKKYLASFSLRLEDFSQGNAAGANAYILKIPTRQTVTVTYRWCLRGVDSIVRRKSDFRPITRLGFFRNPPHLLKRRMSLLCILKLSNFSQRIFRTRLCMRGI